MTSAIDDTKPVEGSATTQSIRDNFTIAKNEITALQTYNSYGLINIKDPTYGAVGDGVTVDTTAIQSAITAASSNGGGGVWFPYGAYKVTALTLPENVHLYGEGGIADTTSQGTWLVGTTGSDVITLTYDGDSTNNVIIRNISFSGGDRHIVSEEQTVWMFIKGCRFSGPVEECFYVRGFMQQLFVEDSDFNGGKYGYRQENLTGVTSAANSLLDKASFRNCRFTGQTITDVKIEVTTSNNVSFEDCAVNHSAGHGIYIDGGIRDWIFTNLNTERNHYGGGKIATTGSITSGTPNLTVAVTTISNSDVVTVKGAGANGKDLQATVSSGGGTVNLVLDTNASTTVSSVDVTNAIYDNVYFNNTIASAARVTFINYAGSTGVGGDGIRYDINAEKANNITVINSDTAREIYDPNQAVNVFGGSIDMRMPAEAISNYRWPSFPQNGRASNIPTPLGGNLVVGLIDSNGDTTGTYGEFQVRNYDSNRTKVFSVRDTGRVVTTNAGVVPVGAITFSDADTTPDVSQSTVFKTANTGATTITFFDGGTTWQRITVLFLDANTTINFAAASMYGNNGASFAAANGDHMDCIYDGANWYCNVSSNTV